MNFYEKKEYKQFKYFCDDPEIYLEITSPIKLEGDQLDEAVVALLKMDENKAKGKFKGTEIKYNYTKKSQWIKSKKSTTSKKN